MYQKLPLNRDKPKEQESLYSFLHRLAIINHYDHLGSMFTEFKSAAYDENCNEIHPDLYWVDFVTDLLSKMKIDIQPLIVNQFDDLLIREDIKSNKRRAKYRKHYHRYCTKFCPECLKEDFFHRIYWDVSYVTTCVKHKKELVVACKCSRYVPLSRLVRNLCHCGKKYTAIRAKKVDAVTLEVQTAFQEFLLGDRQQISREDQTYLTKDEYLDFFYAFSLLVRGIDSNVFAASRLFRLKDPFDMVGPNIKKIDLNKYNLIVNTLHFLTLHPSKDFTNLIEAVEEADKQLKHASSTKVKKNRITNKVFKHTKGTYYHEIYSDYLNNKKDVYINQRFALPPLIKKKKFLTTGEALLYINTEFKTVMNLCKHNLIKLHVTEKNGKKISLIERESIDAYLNMKKTSFTLDQAIRYLGLNFRHMNALVESKLIKPIHGPSVDGYERWYIPKTEIQRFEKELQKKYLPFSSDIEREGITIQKACFKLRSDQMNVEDIYQLIFNDRLRVFHDGNPNLVDGLKILDEDVNQLMKELYYRRINEKGYFGKELQRACIAHQEKINQLLKDKVLTIDSVDKNGKYPPKNYIKKQQVMDYLSTYKNMSDPLIEVHLKKVELIFEPKG
ncbi:TniQ family protein [Psychrobacillus sp. FJAT-51614]|uniref:TniQ family protein n=1 Tax=Psychrobacillus mangrovi TaxID=3117745 RepID=A0ABU8F8S9_9BACI